MNQKKRIWLCYFIVTGLLLISSNSCKKANEWSADKVRDGDGNVYNTITIGTQVWMKENLKTTKYNDGTSIPFVTDSTIWVSLNTPGYCWYNNDLTYKKTYGALYNWYTVNTGKLCPAGWHVPSDADWKILEVYMGMTQEEVDKAVAWRGTDQGIQIKSVTGWSGSYPIGTDAVGFAALPGGMRSFIFGGFWGIGEESAYWTSSFDENSSYAWYRGVLSDNDYAYGRIYRNTTVVSYGFSVRCLKDN